MGSGPQASASHAPHMSPVPPLLGGWNEDDASTDLLLRVAKFSK